FGYRLIEPVLRPQRCDLLLADRAATLGEFCYVTGEEVARRGLNQREGNYREQEEHQRHHREPLEYVPVHRVSVNLASDRTALGAYQAVHSVVVGRSLDSQERTDRWWPLGHLAGCPSGTLARG